MIDYSFIVPIFNDGDLAEEFCEEFLKVFRQHLGTAEIAPRVELIFVNDGSRDNSAEVLEKLPARFPYVRIIELSRNFGQHIALSCGYRHAAGRFVGMLNVDMQDPPDQIPHLLKHIEASGCDIVFGLRRRRTGRLSERLTSVAFAYFLNKLTGYDFPLKVATLRIMNRRFLDAYNSLAERSRYLPGLEGWLGFRRDYLPIAHRERLRGRSSYNFSRRLMMAIDAVISFSDLPLKISVFFGFGVALLGCLSALALIVQKLFFVDIQLGYTSTISAIVLFSGVQLLVIGVTGLYVGRILREVQHRPLYVIRRTVNLEPSVPDVRPEKRSAPYSI